MNLKTVLFDSGISLSQRVVRSGIWVMISQVANQGFRFVRNIILARILLPQDFGLVGIALISTSLFEVFSKTGFDQALIQKKEDVKDYLNTAWVVSATRGIVLFGILLFAAPLIAQFFKEPGVALVIQVMAISLALRGLINPGTIYFSKELEFRKKVILELGSTAASLFVSIPLALILKNVWAIVFGSLAGSLTAVILSYVLHPYRPKLVYNASQAKELFNFGKYILLSSALVFLLTQGDDAFVGRIIGTSSLGLYVLAYRISNIPATQITKVISQVTFPAYSKLQENLSKLRGAFLKTLQLAAFISIPVAGAIFVLAPEFTKVFLGSKWMPMVPAMQVLVFWGVIRALVGSISPVFLALGKPDILTKCQFGQVLILAILIAPLTMELGIVGTSLAVFLSAFAMMLIRNYIFIRTIECSSLEFYKLILFPSVITIISVLSVILVKTFLEGATLYHFFLFIAVFIVAFISLSYIAIRFFDYKINDILTENINLLR